MNAMPDNSQAFTGYTDWKNWSAEQFGKYSKGDARYFAWHLRRYHPDEVNQALEIGYGNGNFMGFARDRGIKVVGIESQDNVLQRAHQAGFEAHESINALRPDQSFDLIVTFDVFEHIPQEQLISFVGRLTVHLRPGGVMLLRVPNGEWPWYRSARNPKRLMRAVLRRLIERMVAFAYYWDVEALAPNLVVALRHTARHDSLTATKG